MRRALWACIGLGLVAACDDLPTSTADGGQEIQPPQGVACGDRGLTCPVGNICLFRDTSVPGQVTPTGIFSCAADPCAGQDLTCTCAALLCGPGSFCTVTTTGTVSGTRTVSGSTTTGTCTVSGTGTVTATGTRMVNCRNAP